MFSQPQIIEIAEKALKEGTTVALKKTNAKKIKGYPVGTVFIGKDKDKNIKIIVVKDEMFLWVLNLEIASKDRELCEVWDLERFTPTGFEGKLLYKNRMGPGAEAAGHYHKKKQEVFFVLSLKGKLMFTFIEVVDENTEGRVARVELSASKLLINGREYFPSLQIGPNILHIVNNYGKTSVLLGVVADRPYNWRDDFKIAAVE